MLLFKTVDVAIGIVFLYLLLTFVASAILEMISTTKNWRARMLHDAIANMLKQSQLLDVRDIYNDPLILALSRDGAAKSRVDLLERFGWQPATGGGTAPSYIPAAMFSAAVLQGLMNKTGAAIDLSPDGAIKTIRDLLGAPSVVPPGAGAAAVRQDALRSVLETTLATQGASIQAVRLAIEKWFNDTMDRASGWYKRRAQSCLLLIGLVFAFSCNIDTIGVARWLWRGDAARQAVLTSATEYVRQNPLPPTPSPAAEASRQDAAPKDLTKFATQLVTLDQRLTSLQYPIGWPPPESGVSWFLQYLLGAIITAIAISMGSTFWFDALQNLIKIRGTGPKPGSR